MPRARAAGLRIEEASACSPNRQRTTSGPSRMPDVNIARIGAADLEAYRELMLHAYEQVPDAFTSTAGERAAEPHSWWARRIGDSSGLAAAFGAFDRGSLVGTVAVEFSAKPKTRHKASILGMYVRTEARRKGAARALMWAALEHCRSRGDVSVVQLTVTAGNEAAVALYSSFGFRQFGLEPKAMRAGSGYLVKQHMWLDLEAGNAL